MTAGPRREPRRVAAWALTLGVAVAIAGVGVWRERTRVDVGAVVFSTAQAGTTLVIPLGALPEERRAAEQLRATLAVAAHRPEAAFPIQEESGVIPRRGIFVGATRRGGRVLAAERKAPFDTAVGCVVRDGAVYLWSERRQSIQSAVSWFLEKYLGAHWYIPGPLGEFVPHRSELVMAAGAEKIRPGFIHRSLSTGGPGAAEWYARNRLEAPFEHSHNLVNIFRPEDLQRNPEMAPMRMGKRFIPSGGNYSWQPNMLSRAAVEHAASAAIRAFDADPKRLSFSLSTNDSDRYDDSAETLAAVAPPRFFRHRNDYSDYVFRFTNAIAEIVAKRHPDRWLPAYAYYWCENAPSFPVARNVVPFLTADRSRWSFPAFAAEDKALIERWCKSGAEIVGVYDYFYGSPFFCPRPTIYAVKESIPFEYKAGVRAFYAEATPNWGLDGPKPWLAAQLLWSPEKNPDELLDTYYREFWAEAAEPMRAFFAVAERTWQEQPGPPLWLRYYNDEDQAYVYPPERRVELRTALKRAELAARDEKVRARVAMVVEAMAVCDAYWTFCTARENLSRLARPGTAPAVILSAWKSYREARSEFILRHTTVRRTNPLALAATALEPFLRNQPDSRAVRELNSTDAGRVLLQGSGIHPWLHVGATGRAIARITGGGEQLLQDPGWLQVNAAPVGGSGTVDWTPEGSVWRGSGEPWEGRTVQLSAAHDDIRVLRLAGCRTESMGQWALATPQMLYAAQVKVRAKTSPGTATYLIMSFLDEKGAHIDMGRVDRLPADPGVQEVELCVVARAPANAKYVGLAVCTFNQINDDFAEFSDPSLRQIID